MVLRVNTILILVLIGISSLAARVSIEAGAGQAVEKKVYVCPPCGAGCDDINHDKPGGCPVCGMTLIEKGSAENRPAPQRPQPPRKNVAILIFDGVQIIDYTGPYEVFGQAGFNVYTVSEGSDAITTAMGMRVTPSFTLETAPKPNVVVIPGGEVVATQNNQKVIKWIQDNATDADHVLSVCNGAYILAKTGLLDGQSATTFYDLIDGLVAAAPKTKVVTDKRFVDNGKTITTAGISSGIDGSLHVVSKLLGKGRAQQVALNMEYHWQPEINYARASFADIHLRRIFTRGLRLNLPPESEARVLSTEGTNTLWEVNWEVKTAAAPQAILENLNTELATRGKWVRATSGQASQSSRSEWTFTDDKGGSWIAVASVQPLPDDRSKLKASVRIESRK